MVRPIGRLRPLLWLAPALLLACRSSLEVEVSRYQGELILSKDGRERRLESVVLTTHAAVDSHVYEAVKLLWGTTGMDARRKQTLQTALRLLTLVAWKNPLDPSRTLPARDEMLQRSVEGKPQTIYHDARQLTAQGVSGFTIDDLAQAAELSVPEALRLSGKRGVEPVSGSEAERIWGWFFDYISRTRSWLEPPSNLAPADLYERSLAFSERLHSIARAMETLEEPLRLRLAAERKEPGKAPAATTPDDQALEVLARIWTTLEHGYPRIAGLANFGVTGTKASACQTDRTKLDQARTELLEKLRTSIPTLFGDPATDKTGAMEYLDLVEAALVRLGELENPYVPVPSTGSYLALEEMYQAARKAPNATQPIGESWQRITQVKVTAGANANYVVMRDHVGNWQVRAARNDPTELINAAYGGALAVLDLATQTGSASANLRSAYRDFVDQQKAGIATPLAIGGLIDLLQRRYDADLAALEQKITTARAELEAKRQADVAASTPETRKALADATQALRALLEEKVTLQEGLASDLDLVEEALHGAKPAEPASGGS